MASLLANLILVAVGFFFGVVYARLNA